MTWREFSVLTRGLLAADTRLSRHFRPKDEPPPTAGGDPHV